MRVVRAPHGDEGEFVCFQAREANDFRRCSAGKQVLQRRRDDYVDGRSGAGAGCREHAKSRGWLTVRREIGGV